MHIASLRIYIYIYIYIYLFPDAAESGLNAIIRTPWHSNSGAALKAGSYFAAISRENFAREFTGIRRGLGIVPRNGSNPAKNYPIRRFELARKLEENPAVQPFAPVC